MSEKYDEYLREHVQNVQQGVQWILSHLDWDTLCRLDIDPVQSTEYAVRHDESKYTKEEYDAYDAYFNGGNRSYKVVSDFRMAWLHHIHNNPHHWQYWVLFWDDPKSDAPYKALEMPVPYVVEMIADWWSFSWKSGNLEEIFDWYDAHKNTIILNPKTRKLVEELLDELHKAIIFQNWDELTHSDDPEDKKYGVPEQKKFPMPDADHVRSAIRFFNYVEPKYEEELAAAIKKRMKEYGLTFDDFTVGDENRFKNYIPDEYLAHHGRLGQKWGVQNGPPYPLDQKTVDKVYGGEEKKQNKNPKLSSWADRLDNEVEKLKNELRSASPSQKKELEKKIHDMQEDADARYRMAKDNGPDDSVPDISKKQLEEFLKEHPFENLGDLKKLDENADIRKVRNSINHPEGGDDSGRHYNCPNCAAAFELTERGYDVIARPKKNGSNVENIEDFFKGGKLTNVYPDAIVKPFPDPKDKDYRDKNYEAISALEKARDEAADHALKQIKNQGIGARGIIVVGWIWEKPEDKIYRPTGYHAMNYKVVSENGYPKIQFFDTQARTPAIRNGNKWHTFLYDADPRDIYIMRTDNLELNNLITTAIYSNKKG